MKSKDQEEGSRTASTPRETGSSSSVISREMTVRGDCVVDGHLRIEGQVHGSVRAKGLELARTGSVQGDVMATDEAGGDPFTIDGTVDGEVRATRVNVGPTGSVLQGVQAEEAYVRGSVEGGIVARRRLVLEETAVVEGDVRARTLALKEGGQVNGTIVMGERAAQDGEAVEVTDSDVSAEDAAEPETAPEGSRDSSNEALRKASA